MKRRLKIGFVVMVFAVLSGVVHVSADETGITLKMVGTLEDPGKDMKSWHEVLVSKDGENDVLHACDGSVIKSEEEWEADHIIDDLYVVKQWMKDGMIQYELIKEDGTIIIPFGPGIISFLDNSERFLKVVYAEEETDNIEEAIMYITSSIASIGPSENDTLYKGYIKVFDIEANEFIESITVTTPTTKIYGCGDTVYVKNQGENGVLYDNTGAVLNNNVEMSIDGNFFYDHQNNMYIVYNNRLERLFETEFRLWALKGISDYIVYNDGKNKQGLMDKQGNTVVQAEYDGISSFNEKSCKIYKKSDKNSVYGVLGFDGEVIVPCEYNYITQIAEGYILCSSDTDDYTVYGPDGTICKDINIGEETSFSADNLNCTKQDENGVWAYVINDGDFTLHLNKTANVSVNLLSDKDPVSGKYGLYDTVTGEQLLDYEYSSIEAAYGKIYAYYDGAYTVYEIER